MEVITCSVASVQAPVISVREPRIERKFEGIENVLNYLVTSRDIKIYSEMSYLPESISTDMKTWEIKELPETVSYQVRKWFLNVTGSWSIFHKNNGSKFNVGYINEDWVPVITDKWAKILLSIS